MKPETVLEAYKLFFELPEFQSNPRLADNLRTTLRRLVLPSYGFTEVDLRSNFEGCLAKVSLRQFQNAETIFNNTLLVQSEQEKPISYGSVRNYRSALTRFLGWLNQQDWYGSREVSAIATDNNNFAPQIRNGRTIAKDLAAKKQLNDKFEHLRREDVQRYGLAEKELNLRLATQLKEMHKFWTDGEVPARKGPAMSAAIFKTVKDGILCFLGWHKNEKLEPQENLSLELFADFEQLQAFISWGVSEQGKDNNWATDIAKVALRVSQWLNQHSKRHDFGDIAQIKQLRKYIRELELVTRVDLKPYALKLSQLTEPMKMEVELFRSFCRDTEVPERKKRAICEETFQGYLDAICYFFGWRQNIQGIVPETLRLEQIISVDLLKQFIKWGIVQRGNGYGWASQVGYAALAVAKWLNPQSKRQNFSDIEQVEEIREYVRYLRNQHNDEESRQNLDEQRMSFHEAQKVVEYLKQCCHPKGKYGEGRSESAVMKSWQRYLIVAILTYCPVRQREIRELELNKTLFREADGFWVKLNKTQHKAGSKTRKGREYPLPVHLTADLDEWLQQWRPLVPTSHNLVFICTGSNRNPESRGQPLKVIDVSDVVSAAVYKATSILFDNPRRTTPHMFRRIAITYQRRYGRSEQKEALAELMGHSVAVADRTYNEETGRERTLKASEWWKLELQQRQLQPGESTPPPVKDWIEEDELDLKHLHSSPYSNENLRGLRDQALLVIWALQELAGAEMHRLNVGDLVERDGQSWLIVANNKGSRTVLLKAAIAHIVQCYLEARKAVGESLTQESPLFIGIGNRSGGDRLTPWSIGFVVKHYLGPISPINSLD
jgi:site-specific recombinase XerD